MPTIDTPTVVDDIMRQFARDALGLDKPITYYCPVAKVPEAVPAKNLARAPQFDLTLVKPAKKKKSFWDWLWLMLLGIMLSGIIGDALGG